jgi:hypothetical protein
MRSLLILFALIGFPFANVAAQRPVVCDQPNTFVINKEKPSVYIEFEQFGKADDWGNAKLGEVSQKPKIEKGKDIWLRLYNNSCWDISFKTLSGYMYVEPDPANPGKIKFVFDIRDGAAANVVYTSEEQDGKVVPWGGDSFSRSHLLSGRSLVFPVYREHLEKGRSIYVDFNYGWEENKFSNNLAPDHHAFFWGYRLEEVKGK